MAYQYHRMEHDIETRDYIRDVLQLAFSKMTDNEILALFMYTFGVDQSGIGHALGMTQSGASYAILRAYGKVSESARAMKETDDGLYLCRKKSVV